MSDTEKNKKYILTSDCINLPDGTRVHRIRATKSFGIGSKQVLSGQLGGYILKEANLSHDGSCRVKDNAIVCDSAKVLGEALISGPVTIRGQISVHSDVVVDPSAPDHLTIASKESLKVHTNSWSERVEQSRNERSVSK